MRRLFRDLLFVATTFWAACVSLAQPAPGQKSDNRNILWSVDWSSDGRHFAVGGAWVGIFDAETKLRRPAPALQSLRTIAKVRWHPYRNLLALSGGGSDATAIYDPVRDRKTLLKTKEGTRGVGWNASGELLATAGNCGELQIWNMSGQLLHTTRPENAKSLTGVAWHPTEDKIITVGEFITLYDGQGNITRQIRHRREGMSHFLLKQQVNNLYTSMV